MKDCNSLLYIILLFLISLLISYLSTENMYLGKLLNI